MDNEQTKEDLTPPRAIPAAKSRIMVAVDLSDPSSEALASAVGQALNGHEAELHVACVLEQTAGAKSADRTAPITIETVIKTLRTRVVEALRLAGAHRAATSLPRVFVHVRLGSPADELLALASETQADLVVMGTHGRRGLDRLWTGSVSERVARLAPCPVLVVRPKTVAPVSAGDPKPEPACAQCLAQRSATAGQAWWCEQHTHRPHGAHVYSYSNLLDYQPDLYDKVW